VIVLRQQRQVGKMDDIRRLCRLWCLWNVNLLEPKDVLYIIHKEKLFEPTMTEEWDKVSAVTEEEWEKIKQNAETILKNHSLHRKVIDNEPFGVDRQTELIRRQQLEEDYEYRETRQCDNSCAHFDLINQCCWQSGDWGICFDVQEGDLCHLGYVEEY